MRFAEDAHLIDYAGHLTMALILHVLLVVIRYESFIVFLLPVRQFRSLEEMERLKPDYP